MHRTLARGPARGNVNPARGVAFAPLLRRKRREKNVMLVATILIGFAMMTLGVALLILGEVPFLSGKRIPAARSRLIGAIFVAFLPLALGVRQLSNAVFGSD